MVSVTAEVVIVGAGVVGSSTALELARSGLRVTVVDRLGGAGNGSTSASSAVVRFTYPTAEGVAAAWESRHCWEGWRDHLGAPAGEPLAAFTRCGVVMLDVDLAPRSLFTRLFDTVGVPYEEWEARELAARLPALDTGRYWPPRAVDDEEFFADASGRLGALCTPDGGFVDDPQLAAANLAAAAQRHGASFRWNTRVTAVSQAGGRVSGVRLDDGTALSAPVVVNAAGPWSGRLNRLAGVGGDFTIGLRPLRQEVHHVAAPPGYGVGGGAGPVVADMDLGTYIRPEGREFLLVGGTEPECDPLEWLDDPDAGSPAPTASRFRTQVTRAARRLPGLRVPGRPRGVAGVYDVADDWTPVYDRTDLDGFYVAIGTSGNQFKNAPLVGRLMSTLIHGVEGGHDHDERPLVHVCEHTGQSIGLAAFSRRRRPSTSTGTVLG
ncbi:NAD(P)/FAD-dependent oxidoreductase [Streptomyces iconiensis]|uniref:FAD-dependent oxidoreductase n=1 Tax=Streptomyces iconiensis TaxID=1384038 RepID=A0ABT6ZSR0_9ACTN|nr:FAD-dependent oxidoreductase [Streptomyces iconiensis]MDJ1132085.1 FAD-dependent oxidoreductase [Streptomyces iconiensis]